MGTTGSGKITYTMSHTHSVQYTPGLLRFLCNAYPYLRGFAENFKGIKSGLKLLTDKKTVHKPTLKPNQQQEA